MLHMELITGPTTEPISLAEMKQHLRVDFDDDNDYIESLITVSRAYFEQETGHLLGTQTWRVDVLSWSQFPVVIPYGPLQAISSVTYTDTDDNVAELNAAMRYSQRLAWGAWVVHLTSAFVAPSVTYREYNAVSVNVTLGATTVPPLAIHAIRLLTAYYYENREAAILVPGLTPDVSVLPLAVSSIIRNFKIRSI